MEDMFRVVFGQALLIMFIFQCTVVAIKTYLNYRNRK